MKILLIVGLVIVAGGLLLATVLVNANSEADTAMGNNREMPPIDAARPPVTATATFALG